MLRVVHVRTEGRNRREGHMNKEKALRKTSQYTRIEDEDVHDDTPFRVSSPRVGKLSRMEMREVIKKRVRVSSPHDEITLRAGTHP